LFRAVCDEASAQEVVSLFFYQQT